jgi:hypothetical protein
VRKACEELEDRLFKAEVAIAAAQKELREGAHLERVFPWKDRPPTAAEWRACGGEDQPWAARRKGEEAASMGHLEVEFWPGDTDEDEDVEEVVPGVGGEWLSEYMELHENKPGSTEWRPLRPDLYPRAWPEVKED